MTSGLLIVARLDVHEDVWLAGMAAIYDPPVNPAIARREFKRLRYEGYLVLETAPRSAERILRQAIEIAVDTFLLDRAAGADLYMAAHTVGALVEERFGCSFGLVENGSRAENRCGILALHSRVGLSPGGKTWGHCSICEARDFQCDHVPGVTYDGQRCIRHIDRWDGDEISVTARPRDPRCFRTWSQIPVRVGDTSCQHCRRCAGRTAIVGADLTPTHWPEEPGELIAATDEVSRTAIGRAALDR